MDFFGFFEGLDPPQAGGQRESKGDPQTGVLKRRECVIYQIVNSQIKKVVGRESTEDVPGLPLPIISQGLSSFEVSPSDCKFTNRLNS